MRKLLVAFCWSVCISASAQIPHVITGRVVRWENIGDVMIAPRTIDLWLPEGYNPSRKYAVLYMHDGQMLFDSTVTWNKQEWTVDECMSKLMREGKVRETIVVGVHNNGPYRHQEYFPGKPLNSIDTALRNGIIRNELKGDSKSDAYLRFLVYTVKPKIDSAFSTKKDPANTFIAGSSMGGLISLYAICEYPEVFGGAACLSTHWIGSTQRNDPTIPNAFNAYLETALPSPKYHKIYFDLGDKTLDAMYPQWQKLVDETMRAKGFTPKNWVTMSFPGEDHSEHAWAKRLELPLIFLLQ